MRQLDVCEQEYIADALCHFLSAFAGLKHLYIYFDNPPDWMVIVDSMSRHKATLQDLVLHGLSTRRDVIAYDSFWQEIMEEISTYDHLISIGLNASPSFLVSMCAFPRTPFANPSIAMQFTHSESITLLADTSYQN